MILTENGVLKLMQRIKSFIASQLNTKANSVHTHTISEIDDLSSLQMGGGYTKSEIDTLLNGKSDTSHTHTTSDINDFPTIPSKTSDLTNDSCIPLNGTNDITGTGFFKSTSDSQLQIGSGTSTITGGCFVAYGSDYSNAEVAGAFRIRASKTSNYDLLGKADGSLTWGSKNVAMQEDTIPRSGGAVMTGSSLGRNVDTDRFDIYGGTGLKHGGGIAAFGASFSENSAYAGVVRFAVYKNSSNEKGMYLFPNGTWTWNGTACQIGSDQRLKQQITQIDNALLDAWEDVEPVQFKYNDAVNEKGDNARLHTGYVVQQIDTACKSHNVDISEYGLFCHEEYPEETEEVEIKQEDGTTTKETKVIEPAREYYSLRYTETLVVECAYLRRENDKLKQQFKQLEETVNELKSIINYSEIPNS